MCTSNKLCSARILSPETLNEIPNTYIYTLAFVSFHFIRFLCECLVFLRFYPASPSILTLMLPVVLVSSHLAIWLLCCRACLPAVHWEERNHSVVPLSPFPLVPRSIQHWIISRDYILWYFHYLFRDGISNMRLGPGKWHLAKAISFSPDWQAHFPPVTWKTQRNPNLGFRLAHCNIRNACNRRTEASEATWTQPRVQTKFLIPFPGSRGSGNNEPTKTIIKESQN